jgi:phage gpG-like protein
MLDFTSGNTIMTTVTVQGVDEVIRNLSKITSPDARKRVLHIGALKAQELIAKYPPSSIANSPSNPSGRWYERGFGTRSVSGIDRKTSETLGRRWTTKVTADSAVVGNNASYAPFVQGDKQPAFHRARGWKTVEDVATNDAYAIVQVMRQQMGREIAAV